MDQQRRKIDDAEALRAMAHPLRMRLLGHLLANGARTASECAAAVESSPSNCSWHLRQLAAVGLVDRVAAADGRERPWRAAAVGFDFGGFDEDPVVRTAQDALIAMQLAEENRLTQHFLDHQEAESREWLLASALSTYGLRITAAELTELTERIDALLRPLRASVRSEAPDDARVVHLGLRAFPLEQP